MKEPTAVFSSSTWTKRPAITWLVSLDWLKKKKTFGDMEVCVGIMFGQRVQQFFWAVGVLRPERRRRVISCLQFVKQRV